MSNRATVRALIRRGVDSGTAKRLSAEKHTLQSLSQKEEGDLQLLGLTDAAIKSIQSQRPPIPDDTVIRIIDQQYSTCCVCKKSGLPYILHHIIKWEDSHSHAPENLALLCLNCHDEAHTKHANSRNLEPEIIRGLRDRWIEEAKQINLNEMKSDKMGGFISPLWIYFNHNRIIDMSQESGVDRDFREFFASGEESQYLYSGTLRQYAPYSYFNSKIEYLLSKYEYHHINNQSSTAEISTLARPGNLVILTANHVFKPKPGVPKVGPNQECLGYYTRNRNRISFTFDHWEATSMSAHSHLRGQLLCTSVLVIKSSGRSSGGLEIQARCLAIGDGIVPYEANLWPAVAYKNEEQSHEE